MTTAKRALDLGLVLLGAGLVLPLLAGLALAALLAQGRPLLHVSERMRGPGQGFALVKLRSMRPDPADAGVSGGDKAGRITGFGHLLRRCRGDELPQLWNVLKGEMSLVGPRPPLRRYVEAFPELYTSVLAARPGLTGLATLVCHRHEARLLAACRTPAETDAVYARRCVPLKARVDLIYLANRSLAMDLWLIVLTLGRVLRLVPAGRRLPRRRGARREGAQRAHLPFSGQNRSESPCREGLPGWISPRGRPGRAAPAAARPPSAAVPPPGWQWPDGWKTAGHGHGRAAG